MAESGSVAPRCRFVAWWRLATGRAGCRCGQAVRTATAGRRGGEIRCGRRDGVLALLRRFDRSADARRHDAVCLDRRTANPPRPTIVTGLPKKDWTYD